MPGDYTFHLYLAYSGDSMIELIQPVSGMSVFHEFMGSGELAGGVQHIGFMVDESAYEAAVSRLASTGARRRRPSKFRRRR